jgi:signal transduction histidine kinase
MNNKGVLTIKVSKKENEQIKISFKDTGIGISNENISKLFQPLFTTKTRGIGFGLLICKMMVEKHKGSIDIKSSFGKGTMVTITLPLTERLLDKDGA